MQLRRLAAFWCCGIGWGLVGSGLATNEPEGDQGDIWQDEPTESRQTWWQRDLTDETANKVLKGLRTATRPRQRNWRSSPGTLSGSRPSFAKPGQPELDQMTRERTSKTRRQKRNAEFVEWLKANYPKQEQELTGPEGQGPASSTSPASSTDELNTATSSRRHDPTPNSELFSRRIYELKRREAGELCRRLRKREVRCQEAGTRRRIGGGGRPAV